MSELQRSSRSFRRQGSSGSVWEDRFISEELNKIHQVIMEEDLDNNINDDVINELTAPLSLPPLPPPPPPMLLSFKSPSGDLDDGVGNMSPKETLKTGSPLETEPSSPKVSGCGLCFTFRYKKKTKAN
ncbi:hypothetical protein RIF29_28231 [Crotalaria pallida]|uniref:Uncharacterized protein n=1 Tax=Crotalaria pallida TaxID=3830 RepID=A0AAN9I168_CROPI